MDYIYLVTDEISYYNLVLENVSDKILKHKSSLF